MNPFYGTAAIIGLVLVALALLLVMGLLKGQARAERILRSLARRFKFDEDHAAAVVRQVAARLRDLASDPKLLSSVIGWATANWLLDAAALWVFIRAFGGVVPLDGLIVAFGLANVLSSVPITPGGLGIVEGIYIPTLVGFGLSRSQATLGVISYRVAQYWLPILLGGLAYLSLRVGPWSIERPDRLERLRVLAKDETEIFESGLSEPSATAIARPIRRCRWIANRPAAGRTGRRGRTLLALRREGVVHRGRPARIVVRVPVALAQLGGERPGLPLAERPPVDADDRHHATGGGGEERLVRTTEVVGPQDAGGRRNAGFSGDVEHGAARHPLKDA